MRCLFALVALLPLLQAAAAERKPNIIYILADDLGYTDLGATGSRYYETPNLDRLASQGLRFNRYYHCQNCQPTRAALMSGQYGSRTGVYTVGSEDRFSWWKRSLRPVPNVTQLPLDRSTVAQSLRQTGFATAMFGKWHLGEQGEYHPARRGFAEAIVTMGKHFDFSTNPKTEIPVGMYLADFLTDKAVDFIRRKKDMPFFLYLPHFGVHAPHQAKPELIAKFKSKSPVGGHHDPTYAAMISSVDDSVGRILAVLDELKLSENTILIFASDNGGVGGYVREGLKKAGDVTDNAPLRSGKGSLYEGGIRVPFFVRWPGVTPPGAVCETPATHVDIYPTFLEVSGGSKPNQPLDGESLVPLFRDPAAKLKRDVVFAHFPGYLGAGQNTWRTTPVGVAISGEWKLLEFYEDHRLELYKLSDDVGESKNLAEIFPDKANELLVKLRAWRKETGAKMPSSHEAGVKPKSFGRSNTSED